MSSPSPESELHPRQQVRGGNSALLLLNPALCSPIQERDGYVGANPEKAMRMIRGLEPRSCEDRRRQLGFLSLEKKRFWRDRIETFQYLKGAYGKKGE